MTKKKGSIMEVGQLRVGSPVLRHGVLRLLLLLR